MWLEVYTLRGPVSEYETLVQEVHSCTLCTLSQKRTMAVPGEGALDADIMFIGEGPGFYEDQQGRPFVGPAGRLLEELLASIGLKREDVYITNMIKCRAPNNRDPLPGEIEACKPYLDRQLAMIRPRVVVTLGRYSFAKFFPDVPIGKARGSPRSWNGLTVYPVYHPAAALRNSNFRSILEEDFQRLPSILAISPPEVEEDDEGRVQQLSFF
jgi:DNA polymerase